MESGLTIWADENGMHSALGCNSPLTGIPTMFYKMFAKNLLITGESTFRSRQTHRSEFGMWMRLAVQGCTLLAVWIAIITATSTVEAVKVSDGLHDRFELQDCFKVVGNMANQEVQEVVTKRTSEQPTGFLSWFPRAVSVRRRLTGNHLCTGANISPGVVLVPASCLDDKGCHQCMETGDRMPEVTVFGEEEPQQTLKHIMHPTYNGDLAQGHDIAILLLANSKRHPLLDKEEIVSHVKDSFCNFEVASVSAFGWFRPGPSGIYGPPAKELRKVEDRKIVACNSTSEAPPGTLCSRISNGCEWDRGAALLSAERGCVAGLASFFDVQDCGSPYIFTNTSAFRDWIFEQILLEVARGGETDWGTRTAKAFL